MLKSQKDKYVGLASLYAPEQLRSYFLNFIYFIIGVEIFIFLVSFMSHLGPGKGPFPWKFYFYIAFIVPVAITFLLGLFIIAFNRYIFGGNPTDDIGPIKGEDGDSKTKYRKFGSMLHSMRQIPFVPTLFIMVFGSMVVYKIDDIFLFVFKAGEKAISYILIGVGVLLAAGIIIGLIWIISNYMLSKKHMEHEYKYRKDVMKDLGFLILDDNVVIDKEGRVVSNQIPELPEETSTEMDNVKILLPPMNKKEDRA